MTEQWIPVAIARDPDPLVPALARALLAEQEAIIADAPPMAQMLKLSPDAVTRLAGALVPTIRQAAAEAVAEVRTEAPA